MKVYHIPAIDGVFDTREGIVVVREIQEAQGEIEKIQRDFVTENPKPPVSIDVVRDIVLSSKLSKAEIDKLLKMIDVSLHGAPLIKS